MRSLAAITVVIAYNTQDIYCYSCNDARLDLELAAHLSTFGINVQTQTKTEKSMTELVRSIVSFTAPSDGSFSKSSTTSRSTSP